MIFKNIEECADCIIQYVTCNVRLVGTCANLRMVTFLVTNTAPEKLLVFLLLRETQYRPQATSPIDGVVAYWCSIAQ